MASQGPLYPGTTATLANAGTSENAEAWVNPGNIVSDNATEAAITAATYDSPDISQLLVASNFGFTIPAGSIIQGITVEVDRRSIIASSGKDFRVQLAKGTTFANLVGSNKAVVATIWPSSSGVATYGSSTDLWGTTWTQAEITASSFAVMLSASANIANADVGVDYIRVTVDYISSAGVATATGTANNVSVPAVPSAYADAVNALSPVAYWRLGDPSGTTVSAEVGPDGTYINTPTLGVTGALTGDADTAITLNGTDEYISVADTAALDQGNGPLSWTVWLKRANTASGFYYFMTKGAQAPGLYMDGATGVVQFLSYAEGAGASSTVSITDTTTWHFIVGTKSSGNAWKIYIDGADVTSVLASSITSSTSDPLLIGDDIINGDPFPASLDEIALFNAVLTPTEISDLYDVGTGAGGTSVNATVATGTGTANTASVKVAAAAVTAAATGTGLNASTVPGTRAAASAASATGTAANPTAVPGTRAAATAATATGTAATATAVPGTRAGANVATATGVAIDATVTTGGPSVSANATAATATGAAANAVAVPGTRAATTVAAASGTAASLSAKVATRAADTAVASAAAANATVTTAAGDIAPADTATATGAAAAAIPRVGVNAATATASAAALGATAVPGTRAAASVAAATGTGLDITARVAVSTSTAAASGVGINATASTSAAGQAAATTATASGTAAGTVANVAPRGIIATATGAAANASVSTTRIATATAATASGTASGISAKVAPRTEVAAISGTAIDASVSAGSFVVASAGVATATGTAMVVRSSISAATATATATGTGTTASARIVARALVAAASGTAYDLDWIEGQLIGYGTPPWISAASDVRMALSVGAARPHNGPTDSRPEIMEAR